MEEGQEREVREKYGEEKRGNRGDRRRRRKREEEKEKREREGEDENERGRVGE